MRKCGVTLLGFIVYLTSCTSSNTSPDIRMLALTIDSIPFEIVGDNYIKTISLKNSHKSNDFNGTLTIRVLNRDDGTEIYKSKSSVVVQAESETDHIFTFSAANAENCIIKYNYELTSVRLRIP